MKLITRGQHDQNTIDQMQNCMRWGAEYGVLCADGHFGYAQPVGGVIAYDGHISLSGVGFDIACGNKAIKTTLKIADIISKKSEIADAIARQISFGVGRTNSEKVESYLFDKDVFWQGFVASLKDLAYKQLGTVGSGNHYVDVFADEDGYIWIGVHFGSRGFGHKIATHFMNRAGAKDGMMVAPCVVSEKSEIGEEYIRAMEVAGKYAYAGRDWVCDKVLSIIEQAIGKQSDIIDHVHNHHNFAWREKHFGNDYWVVRKGATPSAVGQRGFIGGSMGDKSVIIVGTDTDENKSLLYSTVHGAGRVMGRMEAAGKMKWINGERVRVSEGKVNEEAVRSRIADMGIELRGAGADEAPEVYKRIDDVLGYHSNSIKIETELSPVIVVMAGAGEIDPYKD